MNEKTALVASQRPGRESDPDQDHLVLALESGGFKTECVVMNLAEEVLAEGRGGPTNGNFVTRESMERSVRQALAAAFSQWSPPRTDFDLFALSCMAPFNLVMKVVQEFASVHQIAHFGEAEVAFAADDGTEPDRVVIVAGTGSTIFGVTRDGRSHHVGGWGANLGDEGGGYDIGLHGLRAAIYSWDGRGPKTSLEQATYEHYQIKHLRELISLALNCDGGRPTVASFAPRVSAAAAAGDPVAQAIMSQAAQALWTAALVVIRKLFTPADTFRVVLHGSVFLAGDLLVRPIRETICAEFPLARVRPAQRRAGVALARLGVARLREELGGTQRHERQSC